MLMKNENKCLSTNPKYIFDEACIDIWTNLKETIRVFAQYLECQNCTFQSRAELNGPANTSVLVNTKYQLKFRAEFGNNSCEYVYCSKMVNKIRIFFLLRRTLRFDEHARYGWNITNATNACSQIYVKQAADKDYLRM